MAILLAQSETLLLDQAQGLASLDAEPMTGIEVGTPSVNGRVRVSGGAEDVDWMEPPPGLTPFAETIVAVTIDDLAAGARIVAPAQIFHLDSRRLVRATYYTLTLAIGESTGSRVLRWWLEPGGDDATLRADALDFLAALHVGGLLVVTDESSGREVGRVAVEREGFDAELEDARRFLGLIAVLEEWSGARIPVPQSVDAEQATDLARMVAIVNARQLPLLLGEEVTVTLAPGTDHAFDEVHLPQEVVETVLGVRVPLGTVDLALRVRPLGSQTLADGSLRVRCRLADDQPRRVTLRLDPPPTRSRFLRRTLVAGLPTPPRHDDLQRRLEARRLEGLRELLDEWEREDGPIDPSILEDARSRWPE